MYYISHNHNNTHHIDNHNIDIITVLTVITVHCVPIVAICGTCVVDYGNGKVNYIWRTAIFRREMRAEEMLCEERVAAIRASPSPERHDEMAPVELDAPVELEAAPQ